MRQTYECMQACLKPVYTGCLEKTESYIKYPKYPITVYIAKIKVHVYGLIQICFCPKLSKICLKIFISY